MQTASDILPPKIVLSQSTLYASQGDIYALDANNGIIRWSYPIRGQAHSTVVGDRLYLNVSHHPDYTVQAFYNKSATPSWVYQVESRLVDAPIVADEIVYVSTTEGAIYALKANDGALLWRSSINFDSHVSSTPASVVFASPLVVDNVVYLAPAVNSPFQSFLYAFQAKNGSFLWKTQIPASTLFPLTAMKGAIYISTYNGCLALQANNGSLIWQYEAEAQTCSQPIVTSNEIYITFSKSFVSSFLPHEKRLQQQALLCALHANDGSLLWQQQLGTTTQAKHPTCPAVTQDAIYVDTDDGCLAALRISDGTFLWRYQTDTTLLSSPIEANGVVYVGTNDGYVHALQAKDGTPLWKTFVSTAITVTSSIRILP